MARIRTIKPQFWGEVSTLSWDARLLLIGILSGADDEGRFIATHASVCGHAFPHEDVPPAKFRKLLDEIARTELVVLYEDQGRRYGYIPGYRSAAGVMGQVINKPQKSALPPPPPDGLF